MTRTTAAVVSSVSATFVTRHISVAANAQLDGRASHRSKRTEHAAISRLRFEPRATPFAVVEKLASVGWHGLSLGMSTFWTGDYRVFDELDSRRVLSALAAGHLMRPQ